MKHKFVGLALAGLAVTAATGEGHAAQSASSYHCKINTYGQGGWVPEETSLRFFEDGKTVEVLDPFINYYVGDPIVTNNKTLKNGKLRLNWKVMLHGQSGIKYNTSFRIDFDRSNLSGRIKVNVPGIPNGRMGGILKCQPESARSS